MMKKRTNTDKVTNLIKDKINKDRFIGGLQYAIDAENTMSFCYSRLASLIKNGRIRNKFRVLSDATKANKKLLIDCLGCHGVDNFVLEDKCKTCKITPESFSLIGALELGLEITRLAISFYRHLLDLNNSPEDKNLFKRLQKEKNKQRVFLKRERDLSGKEEDRCNFINHYCIPRVMSSL